MGFTPAQIDEMSIWEFDAVVNGYIEANTPEGVKNNTLTAEEEAALAADILALG